MTSIAEVVTVARAGLAALAATAEPVQDEWQYVDDLGRAWEGRFAAIVAARGRETVEPDVAAAVERAAEEASSIADPHRAIDWLSTLPQIVLLALAELG